MAVNIGYDENSKLIISGLECACPCEHSLPTQDIYVGAGIITRVPEYIKARGLGKNCVLVADNNTYEIAGRDVERALRAEGFTVELCKITRDGEMEPNETACGEALLTMLPETEFLVAVGSGSVTDTTRVVAVRTGKPFVSVGTAPSMDGYTSVVAPLLLRGVKIHRAANCPEIIVCDLDILRSAPLPMVISGVGDVLGKYIAKADWKIGNIINDEAYCDVCGQIVTDAVNKLLDNVDEIRKKSEKGIRILIEALLLAGMTIMIVGHTRAVASVEHNVVHYWDMAQLARGKKQPTHGTAVGVSTLMVWPLFTRFLDEDLANIDLDAVKAGRMSCAEREAYMLRAYGQEGGATIMAENPGDFLTWEEQLRRIRRAQERLGDIKAVIEELPPFQRVYGAMQNLGAPLTPAQMCISQDVVNTSMNCAKDYRTRYTLFKLIDECGLSGKYLADYPDPLR